MTTISSSCQTSLMDWISTTDNYVLFDIYSPLLRNKGPHFLFIIKIESLQPDEVCHLINSQKHPILIDLKIGTECTKQLLVRCFFFLMCLWMGCFYKMRRKNYICSIILPDHKTMGVSPKLACLLITEFTLMRY